MLRRLQVEAACRYDFGSAHGFWLAAIDATDSDDRAGPARLDRLADRVFH